MLPRPGCGDVAHRAPHGVMVQSLDALRSRLRELGIKYNQLDGVVASDQVFVKDPAGFTWEFQEPR